VPTVCVTGAGAGVDSAWEQCKLEARKILENATDSQRPVHAVLGGGLVESTKTFINVSVASLASDMN